MAQADAARQARRRAGLLLAAVLTAVLTAISMPPPGSAEQQSAPGRPSADLASAVQRVDAATSGRPAATPTVLCVSSPTELLPFAVTPSAVPPSELARLDLRHRTGTPPPYTIRRPAEGDRAPPSGDRTA